MAQSNRSFVLQKAGEVSYEDRPVPEIKDPYDVVINVRYTGICGSDVHYWSEGSLGSFVVKSPMVLGHESAGVVHSVGSKASSLKPGDRVAMEPGIPCRRCMQCKGGRYNLCPDQTFAATPPIDGTLARFFALPEDFCYKLPDHVSLEEGALVEPTSVAVHMVKQANIRPGQSVVIFGAGPVGLLCCAVARSFGASKVVTVDIIEERVKIAQQFAATHAFKPQKEPPEESAKRLVQEMSLGAGADAVIEASGAEVCIQTGIHALKAGGTYVQGGMGKPDTSIPIGAVCTKEINVKGSFRYSCGDYPLALELISSGSFKWKDLISGKVSFDKAEDAFKEAKAGKGIKILIEGPPSN